MQRVLSYIRRAADEYGMIEDGDRIAVGVSGGKDSVTLLAALAAMRVFYPKKYAIVGLTLDMGFTPKSDFADIRRLCGEIGVEYAVVETQIGEIIFDVRKEKSPCSLCARMRRGSLHDSAKELGCNKLALAHNRDDLLETYFMNMIYEGRIGAFSPVTYLDRKDITVIRPLGLMPEHEVAAAAKRLRLPVIRQACPADGSTARESMKELLRRMEKDSRGTQERIFTAIRGAHIGGW